MRNYFLLILILFLIVPSCSQKEVWENSQREVDDSSSSTIDPCPLDDPDDTDGDGVCDSDDVCIGNDASGDSDGDFVCNNLDNCLNTPNTLQENCDTDAQGDACDPNLGSNDPDGDGICQYIDNCLTLPNPLQDDTDGDRQGDVCDSDDDDDGLSDADELSYKTNPLLKDTDNDGVNDGREVLFGTNPNDSGSFPVGAKCADVLTDMDLWGIEARGIDFRAYTNSLYWIGCVDNVCTPSNFYCYDDAVSLRFGMDPQYNDSDTLRALIDPGNNLFDTIPGRFNSCCSDNYPNDICNAPDGADNDQPVNSIRAMCQALGYNNGQLIRAVLTSNPCPEVHALSADGLEWTSDYISSNGYGVEYECY